MHTIRTTAFPMNGNIAYHYFRKCDGAPVIGNALHRNNDRLPDAYCKSIICFVTRARDVAIV